jgi:hypothetical protein
MTAQTQRTATWDRRHAAAQAAMHDKIKIKPIGF